MATLRQAAFLQGTPLMMAVLGDNLDIVLALLSCGADVTAADNKVSVTAYKKQLHQAEYCD